MPTWLDETDADSIELYGDEGAEAFDDSGAFDDSYGGENYDDSEASAAVRRRRAQRARTVARRRALARARARRTVPPSRPTTTKTAVRKTQAAVANLDLENKVQADAIGNALSAQSKRLMAAENAFAANAVVSPLLGFLQTKDSGLAQNPLVKAGVPLAPLLLLRPAKRGEGVGAFVGDPRVWAVGAVAGLAFFSRSQEVESVSISRSESPLVDGDEVPFRAEALDRAGRKVAGRTIQWETSNGDIADVVPATGTVTAKGPGRATITARHVTPRGETLDDFVRITVTPAESTETTPDPPAESTETTPDAPAESTETTPDPPAESTETPPDTPTEGG